MSQHQVTFIPDQKKVTVESGTTILAAALSAQIPLNAVCGGDGVCGKCKVIVRQGEVHVEMSEQPHSHDSDGQTVLACRTIVLSDTVIEIPLASRLDLGTLSSEELDRRFKGLYTHAEDIQEVKSFPWKTLFPYAPLVEKYCLQLSEPSLNDNLSDWDRVCRALEDVTKVCRYQTTLSVLRRLPSLLRSDGWKVTVSCSTRRGICEVIGIEPGDRCAHQYAFVFDIGTTTVTGQLLDLSGQKVLGTKAAYNRQASFGSDVITRIIYAQTQDGMDSLHRAVVDLMNEMITTFAREHAIDLNDVNFVSVAGNTTMIHLLLRIDPAFIRQEPYIPSTSVLPLMRAADAGLMINPAGLLYCAPSAASYVGGDITAGVLACGLVRSPQISLLIDVGTNGEIALGNDEWVVACAASAGPAFEGSGLSCGMRASAGAIYSVKIRPGFADVDFLTIGDVAPRGICGSGYIDLIWGMLKTGVIDKGGRIRSGLIHSRIRPSRMGGQEFVVVYASELGLTEDIVVTDTDLDNLKRAKGAIYSAIAVLVRHIGISFSDIERIYIAGGFGTSLNIENSVRVGLLPDLPRDRFIFVGNSALAGARQTAYSVQAADAVEKIAAQMTYFELSTDGQYMDEYMGALFFPHTDISRFPSVSSQLQQKD